MSIMPLCVLPMWLVLMFSLRFVLSGLGLLYGNARRLFSLRHVSLSCVSYVCVLGYFLPLLIGLFLFVFFFPIYVLTSDCEVFFSNPLPLQKIKLLPFFQNKYFLKFRNKKYNDFYQICLFFFWKWAIDTKNKKTKMLSNKPPTFSSSSSFLEQIKQFVEQQT